jgi:3-methylcrotonyl-CoA carboxylase alpha subunit
MFDKILIANRGEIACRVAATARRLGVRTVAVYSDADLSSKHVEACDEAVHVGPAPAQESYLAVDRIIAAAHATGARAIHPGYGFLSENQGFAQRCCDEALTFIGPPATAIAAMGNKSAAKALMARAGVPLVPGYHGVEQSPEVLRAEAERLGYPLLIKASSGGGGKGMRVVTRASDFLASLQSCQREASAAFGDAAVLLERYLERPRHIEVQVFADAHGACLSLFERDCSVQRRHQKILEEAPAPGLTAERRAAMGEAAVAAARAVGYLGAGTVEFIAEGEAFYFMEMNTRLQVEHPVTEMITGLDLVEWQLRVAWGERLPVTQGEVRHRGHAIEARLYAESPERGFLPSTGALSHLRFPEHVAFARHPEPDAPTPSAVRVDSGVRALDDITPFYDPMIAKLIVWGESREQALHRMIDALGQTQVVGVATNVAFLRRLVASEPFARAELDTGLIARHHAALFPGPQPPSREVLALACAGLLQLESAGAEASCDPWAKRSGWRLNHDSRRSLPFTSAAGPAPVTLTYERAGYRLASSHGEWPLTCSARGDEVHIMLGAQPARGTVVREGERVHVFAFGEHAVLELVDPLAHAETDTGRGGLTAPMPGKIVALLVKAGEAVKAGDPLLVMEAMKMEHTVTAPGDGQVSAWLFRPGDQVPEGATLLEFAAAVRHGG